MKIAQAGEPVSADPIRQTLAMVEDKIAKLTACRIALLAVLGDATSVETTATKSETTRHPKTRKGETKTRKGETPSRPTHALGGSQQAILDALKTSGPMSPKRLAAAAKIDQKSIQYPIRRLIDAGLVTATGATLNRRISLA